MTRRTTTTEPNNPHQLHGEQRLNKLLASAGLGSRRQVDELIEQGRVEVDGSIASQLGMKVDVDTARITVDGELLKRFKPYYYALNKPTGVLCTNRDPQGRPRAVDLIPGNYRLFPVGRLDASSVGLLLMTNDGELTQRLTHPKHGVPKTYFVVVAGHIEPQQLRRLQRGIYLAEGMARVEGAKIRRVRKGATELEITLTEGKNREIRRVLARVGNKVVLLRRISIGPLKLADLPEGAYRPLTNQEVNALYQAADEAAKERKRKRAERPSKSATSSEVTPKASEKTASPDSPKSKDATRKKPSKTTKVSAKTNTASKKVTESDRDPFAWDDDEALLAASPFSDQFTSTERDDFDDDDENDFSFSDTDDDSGSDLPAGMFLASEGDGQPRRGKILDYDDETNSSQREPRTSQPRTRRTAKKGTVKTGAGFRERESSDRPASRGRKSSKKGFSKGIGRKKSAPRTGASFEGTSTSSTSRGLKASRSRKGFKSAKSPTRRSSAAPAARKKSSRTGRQRRRK